MSLNLHYIETLGRFSERLATSSTNPYPAQQAARRFIERDRVVASKDLSELDGQQLTELDELACKVEEQFRALKKQNLPGDIPRAVRAIGLRMRVIEHEKNALEKREILIDLEKRDPDSDLADLFAALHDHEDDRYFLIYVLEKAALLHPHSLIYHLDSLPQLAPPELMRLGVLLDKRSDRRRFADHFKIPRDLMEKTQDKAAILDENEVQRTGSGICLGYTLSNISRALSKRADLFPAARFVQAAYELENVYLPGPTIELGHKILASLSLFPTVISHAARILCIHSFVELQAAYIERTNAIAHTVGKVGIQFVSRIAIEIEQCQAELDDHENLQGEIESARSDSPFYDEEGQKLAPLTVELAKRKNDLKKELGLLKILINKVIPIRMDEVPRLILKNTLKIEPVQDLITDAPFKELVPQLKAALPARGSYELHFISEPVDGQIKAHSVYIRANPPSFCDAGDTDLLTGIPLLKEFATLDEMLDSLQQTLIVHYSSDFLSSFSLTQYRDIF